MRRKFLTFNSLAYSSEIDLSPAYEERQCIEYLKLGLMGTTFVYSSGDYGVEFDGGGCLNPNGTENNGDSGIFIPSFPGGCPYVLSAVCASSYLGINMHC